MTARADPVTARLAVVGGAGAVGSMLVELLRLDGDDVTVVDQADGMDAVAPDAGVRAVLAEADTVVLAVPESVAIAAVPTLHRILRPDALLVETLSVKTGIHGALRDGAPGRPAVGINPMFAPALGMPGRPVAAVIHQSAPAVDRFLASVVGWGARVVRVGADEHDRIAAATQALTHATVLSFGLALAELGVDPGTSAALAPPPHTTLLALLARVGSGVPEVYHDVQAGNRAADRARSALAASLSRLSDAVAHGDERVFGDLMAEAVEPLGDRLGDYRRLCADLFGGLHAPPHGDGGTR
ncbi:prephenate dehydrogenase/arogenate dehydrogenase family protein [Rhodococcus sp. W8901]|uniref:prephenate dehydrogenase/arogenate dehydrogenase family protein n=1 Tax=Rhodococcus sp. W8901 TaxID=2742603 RepID=UPI001581F93A|nr:prephenate dehydrogenase/arogenate dehydrogenase family protein [Rhodococcus sp. W8901]QKT11639.1 prephenate dehydrogenase [Rhodococcus sp. W8901]